MVQASFTSLVGWLKALQVFFVNLSMLVLYLIYRLVLKLGVYASKGMIRLSCRVSSVTLTYRVVQFVTLLLSFLTRNQFGLYQLLGNIVDEGRRIGSVADIQVGDINAQAPVGTTLALWSVQ